MVSPRRCTPAGGEVLLKADNGQPGLIRSRSGRGRAYLLGFCLQDTLFQAWETADRGTLNEINGLLDAIAQDAGVRAHVHSSNGDIEAVVRARQTDGFIFVIAHEPAGPETHIRLRDLPFDVAKVVDVENDQEIPMTRAGDSLEISLNL